ncbi:VacJ family lipoprotein [Alphaproteobacteria bacterium]|nr:VacJ family lipoprotein [Alphaproteobacteria bacterium]
MLGFDISLHKLYAVPLILLISLSGCSSIPADQQSDSRDPYENTNRSVFAFNLLTDDYVLEPVAKTYKDTVPLPAQTALSNHVEWVGLPSTVLNSSFQGKLENATLASLRFLVNGLTFGLVDLMENEDEPEPKDFGQTLAFTGVPEGSYLMVPLLGSHTTRSLAGRGFDFMFNPISLVGGSSAPAVRRAETPIAAITFRSNSFNVINQIKYNSIDPYARTRSAYYQRRTGQLADILPEKADIDDGFGAFFE